VAEGKRAAPATVGSAADHRTVRALLETRLEAVLTGRATAAGFRGWWKRHAAAGALGLLSAGSDRRGREAVDLVQGALDERCTRRIDDLELRHRLRRALGVLRG
jgi:hypothetical protein